MVCAQGSGVAMAGSEEETQSMSTYWSKCVLCKTQSNELLCPDDSKRKDVGTGYVSMATNLSNFGPVGALSTELTELVKQTGDLAELLTSKHAQWHKSCALKYGRL